MEKENTQNESQHVRLFSDYLTRNGPPGNQTTEYTFDIDKFRSQNKQAAQDIVKDPTKYYRIIKKYITSQSGNQYKKGNNSKIDHFNIKFQGNLGGNFVTPRGLNSRMANQLVGLQGIITKIDLPKKYLQKSVHYCEKTKAFDQRQYPDAFNPQKQVQMIQTRTIKSYDDQKNPLQFEYGFSTFKNMEMAVIQELPQMAPPGLLPMSVQVVLQNKLVDTIKPGDRVQMIGIYKLIAGMNTKQKGIFKPYFLCMSIKSLAQLATLTKKPQKTDFQKQKIFEIFGRSIAPSIWGHTYLKKAVLLMLVGGVEKVTPNNTHLRGDINLLMVGDPGTAKSQMLRWVLSTVDVSVGTTGSGASGVGLTAAIVSDKQTGQKTLEAGAMVLADRGVVCIDQFDKMNETDRVAVHEVMEQQTVTIAKAGLHCSLNARCAVIAAANPIYGQYQSNMPPTKNIGMPDSLLSRFDLVFIILDEKNSERDLQISEKVCRNHRLAPQSNDFMNQYMDSNEYVVSPVEDKVNNQEIYEQNNVYKGQGKQQILTQTFLKQYIKFVKHNIEPVMTDQAIRLCSQLWTQLRQKDAQEKQSTHIKVLPITIRSLQSMIRLASAHAKLRQSVDVQLFDVIEGFKLMIHCLYGDENSFQSNIQNIIKNLGYEQEFRIMQTKKPNRIVQPKQEKNTNKIQVEDIKQKMQKLNIKKAADQVDELLRKQTQRKLPLTFSKQQKGLVYKKMSDMLRRKKGNQKWLKISDVEENLEKSIAQKLSFILAELQQNGKIGIEEGKIFAV